MNCKPVIDENANQLGGVLETAVQIAAERRNLLERLRAALQDRHYQEALAIACRLCGLPESSIDSLQGKGVEVEARRASVCTTDPNADHIA